MEESLRYGKKIILNAVLMIFRLFRMRGNRIVLLNDLTQKYAGNPKYVAEYLTEHYPNEFEIIYVLQDKTEFAHLEKKGIKTVKYKSILFFYYAMTAAVFLTNCGGISFIPFRKKQYVINTWHGGGTYKKDGIHLYGDTPLYRKDLKLSAQKTSLYLSTSSLFTAYQSEAMLVPKKKFWEIGMPRNDILVNDNQEIKEKVRQKIGLLSDERLVLFAPTYRKEEDNCHNDFVAIPYGINCQEVCEALYKRFGGKWKFAFRLHPKIADSSNLPEGGILNLSRYDDMQELLLVADVLINDFSSSMWDFMLTGKPVFIFAYDLEHYIKTTGVYTPVNEWPFPKASSNEELEKAILNFDEGQYRSACERHYSQLGGCETGKATQLVCERICEITHTHLS